MSTLKRYLLIAAGILCVVLGTIGIIMPVLPTTPFLLLAAYCFIRSSDRLHHWLIHHRIFGAYIYHYLEHRAVKKSAKIAALVLLWPSLFISMLIIRRSLVTALLLLVGTAVTWHIMSLRTYQDPGKES
jgi:uncharacterized protein